MNAANANANLKGKKVVVVGMGASGIAAAHLALDRGATVTACDDLPLASLSEAARALAQRGVTFRPIEQAKYAGVDLIVVAPGVPPRAEFEEAIASGVKVIGEVELAVSCLSEGVPYAAVGGTNGKSTTTSLLGAILQGEPGATKRVFLGGNLGEPLARHVDDVPGYDAVILEVSSFQMERVDTFHPRAAILLNITADHLDRYPDFAAYAAAKGNMPSSGRRPWTWPSSRPATRSALAASCDAEREAVATFGVTGDVIFDVD